MEQANCVDCGKPLSDTVLAAGLTRCTPCSAQRLRAGTAQSTEEKSTMATEGKQCPRCGKPAATLDQLRCRGCSFLWSKEDPTQPSQVYQSSLKDSLRPKPEEPLQLHIDWYVKRGYRVFSQTDTTAQLVKPKEFSFTSAVLWFLLFGVGLLVYVFYYAAKSDNTAYLTVGTENLVVVVER